MENIVVFKINRPTFGCNDYGDLMVDEMEKNKLYLVEIAKSYNKKAFFQINIPFEDYLDSDAIFEIEYTGALSEKEKNEYIECAKKFFGDANIEFDKNTAYLNEKQLQFLLRVRKITDEECLVIK